MRPCRTPPPASYGRCRTRHVSRQLFPTEVPKGLVRVTAIAYACASHANYMCQVIEKREVHDMSASKKKASKQESEQENKQANTPSEPTSQQASQPANQKESRQASKQPGKKASIMVHAHRGDTARAFDTKHMTQGVRLVLRRGYGKNSGLQDLILNITSILNTCFTHCYSTTLHSTLLLPLPHYAMYTSY